MTEHVLTLGVTGMTCGGCARAVKSAVLAVPGVREASIDLAAATLKAHVDPAVADARALESAVRSAGYGVREAPR